MIENSIIYSSMAFAIGVIAAGLTALPLAIFYGMAGVIAVACIAAACMQRAGRWLPPCIIAVFFCVGAIRFIHADTLPPHDISRFAGQTIEVSARVADTPVVTEAAGDMRKCRYVMEVSHVRAKQGTTQAASGRIMVYVSQDRHAPLAGYGDSIVFTAKIAEPHNYNNPGAYDFAAALKRQGITARASVTGERFTITEKGGGNWRETVTSLREQFKASMKAAMSPEQAAVLFGTVFGGYDGIPAETVKRFTATGIVHILSVSGTHVALVAGIILWLARICRLGPAATAALASGAILLYSVLAGFTPPVLRSAAMGILALAALALGRDRNARTALAITALGMLIYTPGLVYDLSFQLSFMATAGLVLLYPVIYRWLLPFIKRQWLAACLAVTLAAQLSVLPILSWYFNSISLSSFVANLVVVPAIEAIVAAGLAGAVLSLVWTLGGSVILSLCGLALNAVLLGVAVLANLPASTVYLPSFTLWAAAGYYLAVLWIFGYKPSFLPDVYSLLTRHTGFVGGLAISLVLICTIYAFWPRPAAIHFIDVGQGDAVLVTTPRGRAVLIDTGGAPGETGFDIGERVVVPYLRHYGILSLDYLFLTHGHQDHAGGAAAIAAAMPVKHILLAREQPTTAVAALIGAKKWQDLMPAYEGQIVNLDGVRFTIDQAATALAGGKGRSSNETSTVIRIEVGGHSFLITGDLTAEEEKRMAARGIAHTTVLKVAHHGARSSTTPEFLQAVMPQYAVISAGYNNRYGHPHRETLNRLAERNITYYRTDQQGAVVFRTDGSTLSVETFLH